MLTKYGLAHKLFTSVPRTDWYSWSLTKYGLVGNDLIPLPHICYIKHVFCSQDKDKDLYNKVWYLIQIRY